MNNLWTTSTEQYNSFIKRLRTNLMGLSGINLDRREVEEAVAPCLNTGLPHHVLAASLKKQAKTTNGFLATRATPELASYVQELSNSLNNAAQYQPLKESFLKSLQINLNKSHHKMLSYEATTVEKIGLVGVLAKWMEQPDWVEKTTLTTGKAEDATAFEHKCSVKIEWNEHGKLHTIAFATLHHTDDSISQVTNLEGAIDGKPVYQSLPERTTNMQHLKLCLAHYHYRLLPNIAMPSETETLANIDVLNFLEKQLQLSNLNK